jgi:hypothetical protein
MEFKGTFGQEIQKSPFTRIFDKKVDKFKIVKPLPAECGGKSKSLGNGT